MRERSNLRRACARRFAERGLAYTVSRLAGMVDLKFLPAAPRDYEEAAKADRSLFARYYHAMRERGVLLAPSSNELMFLSSEHGEEEIEKTLVAFAATLDEVIGKAMNDLVADQDIDARLARMPGWSRTGSELRRTVECGNFDAARRFVNAVAEIANELDHHPDFAWSWGTVTLTLSSHDAGGITERDFALAARIDALKPV